MRGKGGLTPFVEAGRAYSVLGEERVVGLPRMSDEESGFSVEQSIELLHNTISHFFAGIKYSEEILFRVKSAGARNY